MASVGHVALSASIRWPGQGRPVDGSVGGQAGTTKWTH